MTGTRDTDRLLIITTFILVAVGVVMIYSTSSIMAVKRFGSEYFFVKKHVVYFAVGLAALLAAIKIPYRFYFKAAYPVLAISAIALICIYIPGLGVKVGGAKRWVRLGPLTFQPSEPARLAVVMFLAYSLASKGGRIRQFSTGLLPNLVMPGIIAGLILLEPDFGTAATIAALVFILTFLAGARFFKHLLPLAVSGGVIGYAVVHHFSYMMNRIAVFLDPWKDPAGAGFQIVQSLIAFGSGGIYGVGLGQGKQKLFYLPEAHTDFILSVIGEEFGFIGVGGVMALYAAFLYCGVSIALKAKDMHAKYLAFGLTLMITLQAVINMAVVLGLVPTKGLTLPFISYGGTSLVVNMVAVGILLNIWTTENRA